MIEAKYNMIKRKAGGQTGLVNSTRPTDPKGTRQKVAKEHGETENYVRDAAPADYAPTTRLALLDNPIIDERPFCICDRITKFCGDYLT
jgi:hypothetical protein